MPARVNNRSSSQPTATRTLRKRKSGNNTQEFEAVESSDAGIVDFNDLSTTLRNKMPKDIETEKRERSVVLDGHFATHIYYEVLLCPTSSFEKA
ncbi:unnamed protein product [Cylicocyclus nassatus]|uniref:Uncharacterized protein n=1 Tax=Cylicocyclus nassatus TaxID=53992 RepID=A0AA36GPK7_CYLNA|nr:unnamed protein product [Cylicocyclus nassatus]